MKQQFSNVIKHRPPLAHLHRQIIVALFGVALLLSGCIQTNINDDLSGTVFVYFELLGGQIQPDPQTGCENLRPDTIFTATAEETEDENGGSRWMCLHQAAFADKQELNSLYAYYGASINELTQMNGVVTYSVDLKPGSPYASQWRVAMPGQLIPTAHNATHTDLDPATGSTTLTWLQADTCGAKPLGAQSTLNTAAQEGANDSQGNDSPSSDPLPCMEITQPIIAPQVGEDFIVDLRLDLQDVVADTIIAYMDFDPAFIQVEQIVYAFGISPDVQSIEIDNVAGQVELQLARTAEPFYSGRFDAAKLYLQAVADTNSLPDGRAAITLVQTDERSSDLMRGGQSLMPFLADSTFRIHEADQSAKNLVGTATTQAFYPLQLYRDCEGFLKPGVRAYDPETEVLVGFGSVLLNDGGLFEVRVNDIISDTQLIGQYNIQVKGSNTLSTQRRVDLPTADGVSIDFGSLLLGDANGDDRIDLQDVSVITDALYTRPGEPKFNACADITNGGYINQGDISALIPNLGRVGPNPTYAAQTVRAAQKTNARLSLRSVESSQADQAVFEVVANTGGVGADTVTAHLNFDTEMLAFEKLEIATDLFDENTIYQQVDNRTGRVNIAGSRLVQHGLSGSFTVATVYFDILRKSATPPILLTSNTEMYQSAIVDGGIALDVMLEQLPKETTNQIHLPIIQNGQSGTQSSKSTAPVSDETEMVSHQESELREVVVEVDGMGSVTGNAIYGTPFSLLVALNHDNVSASQIANAYGATDVEIFAELAVSRWTFPSTTDMDDIQTELESNPAIRYAEPNYQVELFANPEQPVIPDDPRHTEQWALDVVEAYEAWQYSNGSSDVVVAIVDTGIDPDHPDLASKLTNAETWYDFADEDSDPTDTNGHGTHCAGIAAAASNNGVGISGLSWQATILPVKVFPDGSSFTGSLAVALGITHAADNEADIISLSLGSSLPSSVMEDAINYAADRGVLLVAAAGNYNTDSLFYPAAFDNVLSVAATGDDDRKASFSNYGEWIDVSAPGSGILSTLPTYLGSGYGTKSGTSMSTPYVAGLASLILAQYPDWTSQQVEEQIISTATDIDDNNPDYRNKLGSGRINALAALYQPEQPTPVPSPTPTPVPSSTPAPLPTQHPTPIATPPPKPTPPTSNLVMIEEISISQPAFISGEVIQMQAVIKNSGTTPITMPRLAVLMRGPDCTTWGCTHRHSVFVTTNLTLAADETYTVNIDASFGDAGPYFAQLGYQDSSGWHHFGERMDFVVAPGLRVTQQLNVDEPITGEMTNMRATLYNDSNQIITLSKLAVIMRGPDCETWGCSSAYSDFGHSRDIVLGPQEQFIYEPMIEFTASGPYFAQLGYTSTPTQWHRFGDRVDFVVNEDSR